jgi:soluble lytic murein transglycosylase-like protein
MRIAALALSCCLALLSPHAFADIYGYVDAQGVAHFSPEKLDERYQLFLRGDRPFDSLTPAAPESTAIKPALARYLSDHPNLKKFEPLMKSAAEEFSIDVALIKAVIAAESGFNPAAVSPKGAVGLMQIMPATAERYGLRPDRTRSIAQKLADPRINIRFGARYLRDLRNLFPDQPQLILASYNAGEAAVQKYRNTIPPYPETRNYVQIVTQFYQMYKPAPGWIGTPAFSIASSDPKRIYMTIPGRRNMPSSSAIPE